MQRLQARARELWVRNFGRVGMVRAARSKFSGSMSTSICVGAAGSFGSGRPCCMASAARVPHNNPLVRGHMRETQGLRMAASSTQCNAEVRACFEAVKEGLARRDGWKHFLFCFCFCFTCLFPAAIGLEAPTDSYLSLSLSPVRVR